MKKFKNPSTGTVIETKDKHDIKMMQTCGWEEIKKTQTTFRPLSKIATEVRLDWKKVNYAAIPYLDAMASLYSINDNYYEDDAKSVVAYFLSNASSWRGETAKKIKVELNQLLKL